MKKIFILFLLIIYFAGCKQEEQIVVYTFPRVSTGSVTSITENSAIVEGKVISDGGNAITTKGVCYSALPDPQIFDSVVASQDASADFSCLISGLKPGHTYYANAFAQNKSGTAYGTAVSYITQETVTPYVETTQITGVTQTSAVAGGRIIAEGAYPVTSKGICWSTSHLPSINDAHSEIGADSSYFTTTISGLTPKTAYFVRAYALNQAGIGYGEERGFMTADTSSGKPCPGLATVEYAGKIYHTVIAGNKCWLRENLDVGTMIPGNTDMIKGNSRIEKYCYNDLQSNCDIYGALYQWDEIMQGVTVQGAKGICPWGWHIPDLNDWNDFVNLYGGPGVAGVAMKNNTMWLNGGNGTNLSGFTALPAGMRIREGRFTDLEKSAYFWVSQNTIENRSWYYLLKNTDQSVYSDKELRVAGFSARCVKE